VAILQKNHDTTKFVTKNKHFHNLALRPPQCPTPQIWRTARAIFYRLKVDFSGLQT